MKLLTIACYTLCLFLISAWLAVEVPILKAFLSHQLSFLGFFGGSMATFAIAAWLILSVPYVIFRVFHPEGKQKLPAYWQYMLGTRQKP